MRRVLEEEKTELGRHAERHPRRDLAAEMDPRDRDPTENLFRQLKTGWNLAAPRDQGAANTPTRQAFDHLYEKSVADRDGNAYTGVGGVSFLWVSVVKYPDLYKRLASYKSSRNLSKPGARLMLVRRNDTGKFEEIARKNIVTVTSRANGDVAVFRVLERDGHEHSDRYAVSCMVVQLL
jgi:hypothetical protein